MTLLAFITGFFVGAGLVAIAVWAYVRFSPNEGGSRL